MRQPFAIVVFVVAFVQLACSAPQQTPVTQGQNGASPAQAPAAPKRLTATVQGNPNVFSTILSPPSSAGSPPGTREMEELMMAGMVNYDGQGVLRPEMAEAVPSLANGLWVVQSDGRMETTWKIREGATWHDGAPFTSEDVLFAARVGREREIPLFANPAWALVDSVEAPDARTVTVKWNKPYLTADTMFSRVRAMPLPKHLLEKPYLEDKLTFTDLPYWGSGFVGTGAYKLREIVEGSHLLLDANDRFVLGRPKIDTIEVKFAGDSQALMTNVLAGAADISLGARLSVDEALQVRDQWRDGKVEFAPNNWLTIYPQFINPDPQIMLDVRFRRAMQHALDRQQLADAIMYGLTGPADSTVSPNQPDYKDVESEIVRYPYDPSRATQILGEMGYTRGPDGQLRDAAGNKLQFEARATAQLDYQPKGLAAVADYWRRIGVTVDEVVVPNQRVPDREYRQTRPGFEVLGLPNDPDNFQNFHSRAAPLPANQFAGTNRSRYMNPELDTLIDQYFVTISRPERIQVLRQIVHHMSDQEVFIGLFYTTTHSLIGNRIKGMVTGGPASTDAWNSEQWDL